ncbi:hypothetical protein DERP_006428 [Dermatophagoides pteronyssinus]|uniref:Uncharacterized protein n=1 Tax=Dermatophagoides pteronyssinus TaxID=6956 RepID=A0ABQ8IQL0_DERPT|nr:hypothetical protein DERP_006428 [Dermatophagoides pteronyssinus]
MEPELSLENEYFRRRLLFTDADRDVVVVVVGLNACAKSNDDNVCCDAVVIGCIVDRLFFELFFDIFVGVVVVVSISFERFFGGRPRLRFKIGIPSIDVKILVPDEYNCCNGDDICLDLFIDDLDLVIEVVGIDCDDVVAVTPGING